MEVGGSHRISCVNVYIIILHASHVEILYDCGQMANLWPCPLWQHPPPPLTPVLEDNLARTRLPTASCLIGSPCTQTQGGNCSVCTLWFKSGPWFSFVIDSVLWDERRESRARLCGWLISQCLVGCGCLSMFGLLQACWGDAHGCYFWIPQNAWCVSVPESLERHLSKKF